MTFSTKRMPSTRAATSFFHSSFLAGSSSKASSKYLKLMSGRLSGLLSRSWTVPLWLRVRPLRMAQVKRLCLSTRPVPSRAGSLWRSQE